MAKRRTTDGAVDRERARDMRRADQYDAILRRYVESDERISYPPVGFIEKECLPPRRRTVAFRLNVLRLELEPVLTMELLERLAGRANDPSDQRFIHALYCAYVAAEEYYDDYGPSGVGLSCLDATLVDRVNGVLASLLPLTAPRELEKLKKLAQQLGVVIDEVQNSVASIQRGGGLIGSLQRAWGSISPLLSHDEKLAVASLFETIALKRAGQPATKWGQWDVECDKPPWARVAPAERRPPLSRGNVEEQIGLALMQQTGIAAEAAGLVTAAVLNYHLDESFNRQGKDRDAELEQQSDAKLLIRHLRRQPLKPIGADSAEKTKITSATKRIEGRLDQEHRKYLHSLITSGTLSKKKRDSLLKAIRALDAEAMRLPTPAPAKLHNAPYIAQRLLKNAKAKATRPVRKI